MQHRRTVFLDDLLSLLTQFKTNLVFLLEDNVS